MKIYIQNIYRIAFFVSFFNLLLLLIDFGFEQSPYFEKLINGFYFIVLFIGLISIISRHIFTKISKDTIRIFILDFFIILILLGIIYHHIFVINVRGNTHFWFGDNWVIIGVIILFFREVSDHRINFSRIALNPPQLFILSFLFIIILGTLLLMLPKATYQNISFLDALFTSTSAVCVTGLIVVDTATYFTPLGQLFIMILIQIGGIGILTVASYFSYFFKGGSSYKNQLILGDINNTSKLGEVFSTLKYVLVITFTIEIIATILIFSSIRGNEEIGNFSAQLFFSVFHSISAFCNAGFSTLSNNLYESSVRSNYFLQLIICGTFIIGGLGFPIVVNLMEYVKYQILKIIPFTRRKNVHRPWILSLSSRITLITTLGLIIFGTIFFYFLEQDHAFATQSEEGKWIAALFTATTPRTAGFNTIDINSLHLSTIMIMFLLMWVGASPASTGGGVKTSTFAISILNIISLGRGKEHIEVFRRRISAISIRRASAVISLSLLVIGIGIMLISIFDEEKHLLSIAFECFSAYSTVGLSLGITASLSSASKLIIIVIMFIGRVSMLSIVIALMKKVKQKAYSYPTEEIIIN